MQIMQATAALLHSMAAIRKPRRHRIVGTLGRCGDRDVFLGFASSRLLHAVSAADVLNEESGAGYQRRFNNQHSLDFRRYIQTPGSTTIPLTFNLRPEQSSSWRIVSKSKQMAALEIDPARANAMYQVDCQHRLGYLADVDVPLAFMAFIGLSAKEEMQIFGVINGKAKGLSTSLLDYHDAQLATDLERERPELFLALQLNDDRSSPWYRQLDLGGKSTSGLQRRASLRTMQKAVKRFLKQTQILSAQSPTSTYALVRDYWRAVTTVLEFQWSHPRRHFLTKGIGVYALMTIAGDLYLEGTSRGVEFGEVYFVGKLSDFIQEFDWSNSGPLKGLGGESGAAEAAQLLRKLRTKMTMRVVSSAG